MLTRKRALEKFEKYLEQRNQSKTYFPYIKILFNYLNRNKQTLFGLTEEQLFCFLEKYSINTKNLFLKALKKYFICFSIKTSLATALISKEIKLIKPDIRLKDYPDELEIKNKVYPKLKEREHIIADFLIATGLRKSEFLALSRRDQIDLNRRIVKVLGKGRKERIVAFPQSVSDEIKRLFAQEPQIKPNVFNYTLGKLRGLCKKMTQELQVKVTPHSLRHIFALSCYKKGLPLVSLSHLLGHSNLETTRIYLNETNEQVVANYNAMKG